MSIEERKTQFKQKIWIAAGENFDTYPKYLLSSFFDYWTEINENGRKMRFEKQKTFEIKKRLARFKMNQQKWNKPQKQTKKRYDMGESIDRIMRDRTDQIKYLEGYE